MKICKNVDEYINNAPQNRQTVLQEIRKIIQNTIPDAEELIAYGMPAYKWSDKPLFYFAAAKAHLGLYPTSEPIKVLQKDLQGLSTSKGCIRIPWNTKIPKTIIVKLLKERIKEIKVIKK